MRRSLSVISSLMMFVSLGFAQRTAVLTVKNDTVKGATCSFEMWARSTGSKSILVGTSSFYFDYNSGALGSPALTNIDTNYTGNGTSTDYGPMTVQIVANKIAVTVSFTGGGSGTGTTLSTASPDGERFCTVNLNITDGSQTAMVAWDTINTALTAANSLPVTNVFSGADNSPLPIQLASFTVTHTAPGSVELTWSTLSEIKNYGFEVQRSVQKTAGFATLPGAFIPGHGTTLARHDYSYTDLTAGTGHYFYRLRQIDLDGSEHFSSPQEVTTGVSANNPVPTEFALRQNFPNPFNPSTIIEFDLPKGSHVKIELYNIIGQKVMTILDEHREAGIQRLSFNGASLASGVYLYRMTAGDRTFMRKMTLIK